MIEAPAIIFLALVFFLNGPGDKPETVEKIDEGHKIEMSVESE